MDNQNNFQNEDKYHAFEVEESRRRTVHHHRLSFFDYIKRAHLFTFLLMCLLGWSGYQILSQNPVFLQLVQSFCCQPLKKQSIYQPHSDKKPLMTRRAPPVRRWAPALPSISFSKQSQRKAPLSPQWADIKTVNLIKQRLTTLESTLDSLTNRFSHLEQYLSQLEKQWTRLDSEVTQLKQYSERLEKKIDQMNEQIKRSPPDSQKKVLAKPKKEPVPVKKTVVLPKSLYYLHAIVPGRAWLTTGQGKIITVGVGDEVPGCGLVKRIQSNQGVVYLNTGAIIGFNPNNP